MADPRIVNSTSIRLGAIGDLLLAPAPNGAPYLRDHRLVTADIRQVFSGCDLVFGNLECTLPGDGGCVPTEPRVVATEDLVRAVGDVGVNVVTLGNNHTFDHLWRGYQNLRELLEEIRLPHFGAGSDLNETTTPLILTTGGLRVAFLAAVDERSHPYQFASEKGWGVAPLDMDRLVGQIQGLVPTVDHIIVSIHWGEERFLIPSPTQVAQAHSLAEAGATLVLGHHPHVLQGLEYHNDVPIVYSLGNFLADDVSFSDGDVMRWNRVERTGCILLADLTREGVINIQQIPTYDAGDLVRTDTTGVGRRRIERVQRALANGITPGQYRREHVWVKTIKPALTHLRWSELKKFRVDQIRRMWQLFQQSRRAE